MGARLRKESEGPELEFRVGSPTGSLTPFHNPYMAASHGAFLCPSDGCAGLVDWPEFADIGPCFDGHLVAKQHIRSVTAHRCRSSGGRQRSSLRN
eukprot:3716535-Amphidinium_carterae.1